MTADTIDYFLEDDNGFNNVKMCRTSDIDENGPYRLSLFTMFKMKFGTITCSEYLVGKKEVLLIGMKNIILSQKIVEECDTHNLINS